MRGPLGFLKKGKKSDGTGGSWCLWKGGKRKYWALTFENDGQRKWMQWSDGKKGLYKEKGYWILVQYYYYGDSTDFPNCSTGHLGRGRFQSGFNIRRGASSCTVLLGGTSRDDEMPMSNSRQGGRGRAQVIRVVGRGPQKKTLCQRRGQEFRLLSIPICGNQEGAVVGCSTTGSGFTPQKRTIYYCRSSFSTNTQRSRRGRRGLLRTLLRKGHNQKTVTNRGLLSSGQKLPREGKPSILNEEKGTDRLGLGGG